MFCYTTINAIRDTAAWNFMGIARGDGDSISKYEAAAAFPVANTLQLISLRTRRSSLDIGLSTLILIIYFYFISILYNVISYLI